MVPAKHDHRSGIARTTTASLLWLWLFALAAGAVFGCDDWGGTDLGSQDRSPGLADQVQPFGTSDNYKLYLDSVSEQTRTTGVLSDDAMPSQSNAAPGSGSEPSITNNQVSGVDEGDIVKAHGDFLVVLRRGRLFSVRLADKEKTTLTPIAQIPAYAPGSDDGTWYDEMLIFADRIVVIGYSYRVGATEIGLFRIDGQGQLRHEQTHFLRSDDYYSSRNYASRLVGSTLVFYMPYQIYTRGGKEPNLPAIRRHDQPDSQFRQLMEAGSIYRPLQATWYPTLHTVVRCDLSKASMDCSAMAIVGPWSRSFYVSGKAVYLWLSDDWRYGKDDPSKSESRPATLYRLPLEKGAPQVVKVHGTPIDQFSFHEDATGSLHVLVRNDGYGDSMWNPEIGSGKLALVRIPSSAFQSAPSALSKTSYTALPTPAGSTIVNRFVGKSLLYGSGNLWWYDASTPRTLYVKRYDEQTAPLELELSHTTDRIEALGTHALVVGGKEGSLLFTAIDLEKGVVANVHELPNATEGETRSHGFFFKPFGDGSGVLGLPVRSSGTGVDQLYRDSARIVFLALTSELQFVPVGGLDADPEAPLDDACVVSCTDWYGNARPIFYQQRIFALLGYELVEGDLRNGSLTELARTSFLSAEK